MNNTPPIVSVIMPTYNHEKYIGDAVESVLAQTFEDWELILINDGSTDGTEAAARKYTDSRIRYMSQSQQGPSVALNSAIAASQGRFLAFISGDDRCRPQRLERQLKEYQSRTGPYVLFSETSFINDEGKTIDPPPWLKGVFSSEPISRSAVIRRLFISGNFLNATSAFIEKSVLLENHAASKRGPFNPSLFQLQDFDMWVRLIKRCEFFVMPEILSEYRIRSNQANLSSPGLQAERRTKTEHYLVAKEFFSGLSDALFREAFSEQLIRPDFSTYLERQCEEAFLFLHSQFPFMRLRGMELLEALLSDGAAADTLKTKYNFTQLDLGKVMLSEAIFCKKSHAVADKLEQGLLSSRVGRAFKRVCNMASKEVASERKTISS